MVHRRSREKLLLLVIAACLLPLHAALNVSSIDQCAPLSPRKTPVTGVTDLRADDIKVIGGLGDSIMAGFAMMGINEAGTGIVNFSSVTEFRGHSYAVGGDKGAVTVPNFLKHYSKSVKGASVGSHIVSYCGADTCLAVYRPLRDNLNAAQSGAVAKNLQTELDYLISRMKTYLGINYRNDWKLITIQIGSNDQCGYCNSGTKDDVTVEKYGAYVEAAIERIKQNIPKVLVNLLGTFEVSAVFPLTEGQAYCRPRHNDSSTILNRSMCSCSDSEENLRKMDELSAGYNEKLRAIAEKYKAVDGATFGVVYRPMPINIGSFPIDALSNLDCFHPSQKGHNWVAKIYCPTDSDRISVK
ncbi:uncharacterized protein BYT42DRAFT_503695 [Radiomyces spectabilis]|uniref:uncharacterized protein n=1 Tax=Radiomyces spectabilis TaxID=64574 RepID=UPI002220F958|nr:uncharacterized protein BYT42DRAFT_503695 [Radiomyces spectabilis]KAI8368206.1 hypothetical protein BYT42DRAFT_503695 [Radiomyces spectabilis]